MQEQIIEIDGVKYLVGMEQRFKLSAADIETQIQNLRNEIAELEQKKQLLL